MPFFSFNLQRVIFTAAGGFVKIEQAFLTAQQYLEALRQLPARSQHIPPPKIVYPVFLDCTKMSKKNLKPNGERDTGPAMEHFTAQQTHNEELTRYKTDYLRSLFASADLSVFNGNEVFTKDTTRGILKQLPAEDLLQLVIEMAGREATEQLFVNHSKNGVPFPKFFNEVSKRVFEQLTRQGVAISMDASLRVMFAKEYRWKSRAEQKKAKNLKMPPRPSTTTASSSTRPLPSSTGFTTPSSGVSSIPTSSMTPFTKHVMSTVDFAKSPHTAVAISKGLSDREIAGFAGLDGANQKLDSINSQRLQDLKRKEANKLSTLDANAEAQTKNLQDQQRLLQQQLDNLKEQGHVTEKLAADRQATIEDTEKERELIYSNQYNEAVKQRDEIKEQV